MPLMQGREESWINVLISCLPLTSSLPAEFPLAEPAGSQTGQVRCAEARPASWGTEQGGKWIKGTKSNPPPGPFLGEDDRGKGLVTPLSLHAEVMAWPCPAPCPSLCRTQRTLTKSPFL